MQCSSHGALAMHSHAEPTSYSLSQCTLHIVQLLRSSYQQRLCPSLSRGTFNAVQLSWALSMQCSSHGHFQCSAALMGTFNAVQLSWALSMQCSSHGHFQCSAALMGTFNAVQRSGHFQCSAALRALSMQCSAQGTFNAVQLSWVYFVMEYMQPLCCILQYNSHRALTHLSK